jgi:hypothetical protein
MEIADRPNGATWLMTAAEARGILRDMERQVPSEAKRRRQAAFFARNVLGKLSPEAVAVYRAYAEGKVE